MNCNKTDICDFIHCSNCREYREYDLNSTATTISQAEDIENENKTNDGIFAEALIRILRNQIEIKAHIGLAKEAWSHYGDCYYDHEIINALEDID